MNKQTIIRAGVLIIIGIAIGAWIAYPKKNLKDTTIPAAPVVEAPTQNKLFAFLDTFPLYPEIEQATPRITMTNPPAGLLVVEYPTSQESKSFAVYNYKKDILYKGIGGNDLGYINEPIAFIGTDKLLMRVHTFPEITGEANFVAIRVIDFNNNTIKEFSEIKVYDTYPKFGKTIEIYSDERHTETYSLDTETLVLTQTAPTPKPL